MLEGIIVINFFYILCLSLTVFGQIYGTDSRTDVSILEGDKAEKAQATAILIKNSGIKKNPNNPEEYRLETSLLKDKGFCESERFAESDIISGAFCSGTLVSPDTVLTAAHCINTIEECKETAFVFGVTEKTIKNSFSSENIFQCKEILIRKFTYGNDMVLVKLTRPVTNIEPINWRRSVKMSKGDKVYTIGSPTGLPLLLSKGEIRFTGRRMYGVGTTIDIAPGNSGGAVYSNSTGALLGVLTSGDRPYIPNASGCLNLTEESDPPKFGNTRWALTNGRIARGTRFIPISFFRADLYKHIDQNTNQSPHRRRRVNSQNRSVQ